MQVTYIALLIVSCNIFLGPLLFPTVCNFIPHAFSSSVWNAQSLEKDAATKQVCPICWGGFHPSAISAHLKKCEHEERAADGLREYECDMRNKLYEQFGGASYHAGSIADFTNPFPPSSCWVWVGRHKQWSWCFSGWSYGAPVSTGGRRLGTPFEWLLLCQLLSLASNFNAASPSNVTEAAPLADATSGATTDKIRTEYHPRSWKRAKVCGLEEYGSEFTHQCVEKPWWLAGLRTSTHSGISEGAHKHSNYVY
jgi:hypothetical protein